MRFQKLKSGFLLTILLLLMGLLISCGSSASDTNQEDAQTETSADDLQGTDSADAGSESDQSEIDATDAALADIIETENTEETEGSKEAEEGTSAVLGASALSDLFTEAGDFGELYVYTGDALDGLLYPECVSWGELLLIQEYAYTESEDGSLIYLLLFDPASGEMIAQTELACEYISDIDTADDTVMLCDSGTGQIWELDTSLNILEEWTLDADYAAWYLYAEEKLLYSIQDDTLMVYDLEDGSSQELLSSSASLYGSLIVDDGMDLCYVDGDTGISYELWLDLATGEVCEAPFTGGFDWLLRDADGNWLTCIYGSGSEGRYYFGSDEDPLVTVLEEGSLTMTDGGHYLLYEGSDDTELALYDYEGCLAADCTIPDDDIWFYSENLMWSEDWQGYFLLAYQDEGVILYFWDPFVQDAAEDADSSESVTADGDLNVCRLSEFRSASGGEAVSADLYARAEELEETYDIEVRIADQCASEFANFLAEACVDEEQISYALDVLEETLAAFPDGFIRQLSYDSIRQIQINLTGTLTSTNSGWGDESYNGFTEEDGDLSVMVIDIYQLESSTFFHEISHIIDSKLQWMSYYRDDILYSDESWEALNPADFTYSYTYGGFSDLDFTEELAAYFIDTYSMVSPTEDRARIFEYAASGNTEVFEGAEYLLAKLEYYSSCIRDVFDTDGWPQTTVWEEVLDSE